MTDYSRETLFGRMLGLVTEEELALLAEKRIAIPGCGGTGFTYAESLIRMGVGNIHFSDADTFGPENMNRQFGATVKTIGLKKTDVLNERLMSINPSLNTKVFGPVGEDNIDEFLDGVDVVCDTMDFFVIKPRRLLYKEARKRNIPVVICCPVGFGVTGHIFDNDAMPFDEFFNLDDSMTEEEQLNNFGIGLTPSHLYRYYMDSPNLDFSAKKVSSLSSTCLMATSWGGTIALIKLLDLTVNLKSVPYCYQFDIRSGAFEEVYIPGGVEEIKRKNK